MSFQETKISNEFKNEEEDDEEDEEVTNQDILYEGIYKPDDYANLKVSDEVKKLFNYITYYTPQTIEIDFNLKPFIPDFIPAVGDIDGFIKIPRPDGKDDNLGLTVLDEPSCKNQSDPSFLNLKLRATSKKVNKDNFDKDYVVKLVKKTNDIEDWINSVKLMHDSSSYNSSNLINMIAANINMPDIEKLMQELPDEVEKLINEIILPDKNLACSLEEFVLIICDIPVYTSKIASLHLLFNLYHVFMNSQHFKNI